MALKSTIKAVNRNLVSPSRYRIETQGAGQDSIGGIDIVAVRDQGQIRN